MRALREAAPELPWEAKNQAAVHLWYPRRFGFAVEPFGCTADAVATFPETATCVGLHLDARDRLTVVAPYGLDARPGRAPQPAAGAGRGLRGAAGRQADRRALAAGQRDPGRHASVSCAWFTTRNQPTSVTSTLNRWNSSFSGRQPILACSARQ
jgi:Nucleotidyltransferase